MGLDDQYNDYVSFCFDRACMWIESKKLEEEKKENNGRTFLFWPEDEEKRRAQSQGFIAQQLKNAGININK